MSIISIAIMLADYVVVPHHRDFLTVYKLSPESLLN